MTPSTFDENVQVILTAVHERCDGRTQLMLMLVCAVLSLIVYSGNRPMEGGQVKLKDCRKSLKKCMELCNQGVRLAIRRADGE